MGRIDDSAFEKLTPQEQLNHVKALFEEVAPENPSSFSANKHSFKQDLMEFCMSHLHEGAVSLEELLGSIDIVKTDILMYLSVDFIDIMNTVISSGLLSVDDDDDDVELTEEDLIDLHRDY